MRYALLTALAFLLPLPAMSQQCPGELYWRKLVDEANARFVASSAKADELEKQNKVLQEEVTKIKTQPKAETTK